MNFLPKNLAYLREVLGLSQVEMATRLGLKRSTYANYENGETEPKIEMLHHFVLNLGVNAHQLLFSDLTNGKVLPSSADSDYHEKGKVIGKLPGKVIGKNSPDQTAVNTLKEALELAHQEIKRRDETIRQKEETIEALRGQVEALKMAAKALEATINSPKSQRKAV